jgi:predicted N-acetyltransferase YhbS
MGGLEIRQLGREAGLRDFDCGEPALNDYLHRYAQRSQASHFAATYVACRSGQILGYVTLAASQITVDETGYANKPRYPLPTLTLARLAVDRRFQGEGVGTELLKFALLEAVRMADEFGCVGVRVAAKPDATSFYERFGFVQLTQSVLVQSATNATPMFLPLNQIEDALR